MKKAIALIIAGTAAAALTACGGNSSNNTQETSAVSAESTPSETAADASETESTEVAAAETEADLSSPSIVIEFGDYDGISALGKQLINFELQEGTVIKITGTYQKDTSLPAVMERNEADNASHGINLHLEKGIEVPEKGTKIEVTGYVEKGQYALEFHVPADGFKVLEE